MTEADFSTPDSGSKPSPTAPSTMASRMKELQLPISRVKTIMKSSPEVENVGQDSLAIVTKATELFIQELAKRALKMGKGAQVDYSDVAEVVQTSSNLFFLREIIPRKITVKQYKDLMKKEGINDGISSDSESSEDDAEEGEEEEQEEEDGEDEGEGREGGEGEEDEEEDDDNDRAVDEEDEEEEEDEEDEGEEELEEDDEDEAQR